MKREIIVGVLSSVITAIVMSIAAGSAGLFENKLKTTQVHEAAEELVNEHSDVLIQKLKKNSDFIKQVKGNKGDKGDPGPEGKTGPAFTISEGIVVAFHGSRCPKGWSSFNKANGRFIMGASEDRSLGETGGESSMHLTKEQLPAHTHITQVNGGRSNDTFGATSASYTTLVGTQWADFKAALTSSTGESKSVEILPPFVVLRFCVKDKGN